MNLYKVSVAQAKAGKEGCTEEGQEGRNKGREADIGDAIADADDDLAGGPEVLARAPHDRVHCLVDRRAIHLQSVTTF